MTEAQDRAESRSTASPETLDVLGHLQAIDGKLERMDAKLNDIAATLDAGFETTVEVLSKILAKL